MRPESLSWGKILTNVNNAAPALNLAISMVYLYGYLFPDQKQELLHQEHSDIRSHFDEAVKRMAEHHDYWSALDEIKQLIRKLDSYSDYRRYYALCPNFVWQMERTLGRGVMYTVWIAGFFLASPILGTHVLLEEADKKVCSSLNWRETRTTRMLKNIKEKASEALENDGLFRVLVPNHFFQDAPPLENIVDESMRNEIHAMYRLAATVYMKNQQYQTALELIDKSLIFKRRYEVINTKIHILFLMKHCTLKDKQQNQQILIDSINESLDFNSHQELLDVFMLLLKNQNEKAVALFKQIKDVKIDHALSFDILIKLFKAAVLVKDEVLAPQFFSALVGYYYTSYPAADESKLIRDKIVKVGKHENTTARVFEPLKKRMTSFMQETENDIVENGNNGHSGYYHRVLRHQQN